MTPRDNYVILQLQHDNKLKILHKEMMSIMLNMNNNYYNNTKCVYPKRNDIWLVNFGKQIGSKQGGIRPALIESNNKYNFFSPTVTAIPITSQIQKKSPVHIFISNYEIEGLSKDSMIEVEKIQDIDKFQLIKKIGVLPKVKEDEVTEKIKYQFAIQDSYQLVRA